MTRRRGFWVALLLVWGLGLWLLPESIPFFGVYPDGYEPWPDDPWGDRDLGHIEVEKDDRPPFQIDPDQPWQIAVGRGSGMEGLNTVQLDQTGRLVLYRQNSERRGDVTFLLWDRSEAQLPSEAVAAVLEAAVANRLTELARRYSAVNVHDGTQWVLLIRQGDREKVVYFDNHFPAPIRRFGRRLDEIIAGSVGPDLRWRRAPAAGAGGHDWELWDAIRR